MSGKRDRPAHFEIDQKTLQYKQEQQHKKFHEKDSQQKIKQRKIYKIKMPGDIQANVSQTKAKFTLFDNSFNTQYKTQKKVETQQQSQKDTQKKQQKEKQGQSSEKSEVAKKQQQKKSPFGFSIPGFGKTDSFGNGIGIFTSTSIFNTSGGSGIFSKNNIFSKSLSGQGNKQQNGGKPTNSIFGTSQSVFGFSTGVPPIKKQTPQFLTTKSGDAQGDDGDQGDSQQIEQAQRQVIDPSKSTGKYEYKSECETIFSKKALKSKKDNGDMIENTEVIVQHDNEKKSYWVVIRLAATKHPIVTGFIIKGKCQVKKLGNKDENIVVSVITFKDKQPSSHILKIQFETAQDGCSFKQTIQKIIQ